MLEFKDVTIQYGQNVIVRKFNMKVENGEIVSIVGESGSGKTTVIRAALGLLPGDGRVSAGDILLNGQSVLSNSRDEWLKLRGDKMAMIFQDSGAMINPIKKIGDQYVEYIQVHDQMDKQSAYNRAVEMLSNMRLPDPDRVMNSYAFELSGGMKQRVGIAMAMTFNPELLLADEPTSALDVTTQAQIVRQMMEINKKYHQSIICVTHNLGLAAYMSDQIIVMRNGFIVESGDRDAILNHPQNLYTKNLLSAVPTMGGERYV